MSRLFYHVMQDNAGNLLFDVTGTMRLAGSGTLATIYGDEALTVILANPMTNHPSFGSFKCFLPSGDFDFYMAKSGYTFETLTGLQGWGTMALQDASAVDITGGQAVLTGVVGLQVTYGTRLNNVGVHQAAAADRAISILHARATEHGLVVQPTADTGPGNAVMLLNGASATVGSITTTGVATSYNTASDARLKDAIVPLTGALAVVRALKPSSFRWKADDSAGVGFLAHEVAEVVDGVVTGDKDALDAHGQMVPQQIDQSKLVPWLTAGLQALAEQVTALVGVAQDAHAQTQALASRVAALEGASR